MRNKAIVISLLSSSFEKGPQKKRPFFMFAFHKNGPEACPQESNTEYRCGSRRGQRSAMRQQTEQKYGIASREVDLAWSR